MEDRGKVSIEFTAALREKTGVSRWMLDLEKPAISVLEALKGVENAFSEKHLQLVDGQVVRKGILVFIKRKDGKQMRIMKPAETAYELGNTILLSSAMGGG